MNTRRQRLELQGPLLFAVSIAVAAGVTLILHRRLPAHLSVRSDIVGYPTHQNFNVNRYFQAYYLLVGAFPAMAIALYFTLRRGMRAARLELPSIPLPWRRDDTVPSLPERVEASQLGRTLLVGTVFATEAEMWADWASLPRIAIMAAGYVALVSVAAFLLGLRPGANTDAWSRRAAVNALAAPFTLAGLGAVTRMTSVHVQSSDVTHRYAWLPLWVVILATTVAGAWVVSMLRRWSRERTMTACRLATTYLAVPAGLFLFISYLPGALGQMEVFHEGEGLGAAHLTLTGHFPWRDFAFIHGPLQDIVRTGVGLQLLENSRWGGFAGAPLVIVPLFWLSLYCFGSHVFRKNWAALLVATVFAVSSLAVPLAMERFLLWPLVLLAFAGVISQPLWWRCALFATTLVLQVALTPEAAYAVIATGVALLAFDVVHHRRGGRALFDFRRTLACSLWAAGAGAVWVIYLAANGALTHYIGDLLSFGAGHALTGGLPVQWYGSLYFGVAVVAPVIAVLLAIWYFAAHLGRLRELPADDWMMAAATAMTAIYYTKFLARADGHAYQSLATAVPLVLILAAKALGWADGAVYRLTSTYRASRWMSAHSVTLALLPVVIAVPGWSVLDSARGLPARVRAQAPSEASDKRLGYDVGPAFPPATLHDLRAVLDAYLPRDGAVFDFTNEPGLFHYLLDRPPATRYFHVSMAIARKSQERLINELEKTKPKLVVFDEPDFGLPVWDHTPNQVRHYLVSQYLFDTYRPLLQSHGFVFLVRNDPPPTSLPPIPQGLTEQPVTTDLLYHAHTCDWGYAPNFLDNRGASRRGALTLATRTDGPAVRAELPREARIADYRWLEVTTRSTLPDGSFRLRASNEPDDDSHSVLFRSLPRSARRLLVRVGSCSVWHAYSGAALVLSVPPQTDVVSLRLLR